MLPSRNETLYIWLGYVPTTALVGDAGDSRAFLRWNEQFEVPGVVGWHVMQIQPEQRQVTDEPVAFPSLVVEDLTNDTPYVFEVVAVLEDDRRTPPSNRIEVVPREVGVAEVEVLEPETQRTVGQFEDVTPGHEHWRMRFEPVKVIFPDGQALVYDNYRPVDWMTRDGEHMIYPKRFGNGLDIGQMDDRGLPMALSPDDDSDHLQQGHPHPYITRPYTQSLDDRLSDARPAWRDVEVDGDRVTFHYWQPLAVDEASVRTYVQVWETWWPIERQRGNTTYHGLAREVEVQMPSPLKWGYQVMLNNGFGPHGGSREGVIYYGSGFSSPSSDITDFSGDKNANAMSRQGTPRQSDNYHPTQNSLQAHPLLFYDWGEGSLTINARSPSTTTLIMPPPATSSRNNMAYGRRNLSQASGTGPTSSKPAS